MEQTISIIYYFLFAIVTTLLIHLISKHQRNDEISCKKLTIRIGYAELYELILILVIVLFCAFREIEVGVGGTDAYAYMMQFEQSTGSLSEQLIRFRGWEPLHAISLWIVRLFTSEYRVYLTLYYIVMSLFLIKYAKMIRLNKYWFLATFALMIVFLSSFNTQRNTFAVFAGIYILDTLLKGNHKRSILYVIIITGFHISALIWFIIIGASMFIRFFKGSIKWKLFGYLMVSSAVSVVSLRLFPILVGGNRLGVYIDSGSSISIPMLIAFIFVLFLFLVHYRQIQYDPEYKDIISLSTLYIAFAPMFIFQMQYSIMYRMMLYSIPVLYMLLAKFKEYIVKGKNGISLLYVGCNLILLLRILPFFMESNDIGVYSSILMGN